MALVPQQAILHSQGSTYDLALAGLEAQMDELPDVRIISITMATPTLSSVRLVAVVETV
jgi:hypothetical protein